MIAKKNHCRLVFNQLKKLLKYKNGNVRDDETEDLEDAIDTSISSSKENDCQGVQYSNEINSALLGEWATAFKRSPGSIRNQYNPR